MHQKEKVLAPLLETALGLRCIVLSQMDADLFGTFNGEVSRNQLIIETERAKCEFAYKEFHCALVLESYGTFGLGRVAPFEQRTGRSMNCDYCNP